METRYWFIGVLAIGMIAFMGSVAIVAAEEKTAPKNLVPNGDFEGSPAGAESKGRIPKGWERPFAGPAALEIIAETRPGSAGKQCLKIGTDEKVKTGGLYTPLIPFDPKKPLKVSGWIKGGGVMDIPQGGYFGVLWYNDKKEGVSINKSTGLNYTYLAGGYKEDKWIEQKLTLVPSPEGKKETYQADEIPPDAAFFAIMIFSLEYPRPVYFDDIAAIQE
jgi:hypothetical protein